MPLTIGFALVDVLLPFVPFAGEARRVADDPPLEVGTCTISPERVTGMEEM